MKADIFAKNVFYGSPFSDYICLFVVVGGLVCVLLAGAELIYFSTRAQGKSEPWQTALTREMKVRGLSEEGEYGNICYMLYIPRPSYPLKNLPCGLSYYLCICL